jgi:endoglucanase
MLTSRSTLTQISVFLLLALTSGQSLFGADFPVTATDKNHLDTQGFGIFLYDRRMLGYSN